MWVMSVYTVDVTPEIGNELEKSVEGQGGFQALLRELQLCQRGSTLHIPEDLARLVVAYYRKFGRGGFQHRLRPIAEALEAQGVDPDLD
jgi:hypothetical protein